MVVKLEKNRRTNSKNVPVCPWDKKTKLRLCPVPRRDKKTKTSSLSVRPFRTKPRLCPVCPWDINYIYYVYIILTLSLQSGGTGTGGDELRPPVTLSPHLLTKANFSFERRWNKMGNDMFAYKEGSSVLCMPLEKHLPRNVQDKHPDWKKVNCPCCGMACYESQRVRAVRDLFPEVKEACTVCALKLEKVYGE